MNPVSTFKIVLLGEGCVGKTSILLRYTDNSFNEKHIETKQAAFKSKKFTLDGHRIELAIWDTAGQECYKALGPLYYRNAQGAILVFDITDEDSFEKVNIYVKELKRMLGTDVVLCIVANKIDLEKDRNVSKQSAEEYARMIDGKLYNTSAKINRGIEELFNDLTQRLLQKFPVAKNDRAMNESIQPARGISVQQTRSNNQMKNDENSGCC